MLNSRPHECAQPPLGITTKDRTDEALAVPQIHPGPVLGFTGGVPEPKRSQEGSCLSLPFSTVGSPSPRAFLQLLSLSADCKSAYPLWLAVEAKPNGDDVLSSPTCFGLGALAAKILGRGHTTCDGWCCVSTPRARHASKHLTCVQSLDSPPQIRQ